MDPSAKRSALVCCEVVVAQALCWRKWNEYESRLIQANQEPLRRTRELGHGPASGRPILMPRRSRSVRPPCPCAHPKTTRAKQGANAAPAPQGARGGPKCHVGPPSPRTEKHHQGPRRMQVGNGNPLARDPTGARCRFSPLRFVDGSLPPSSLTNSAQATSRGPLLSCPHTARHCRARREDVRGVSVPADTPRRPSKGPAPVFVHSVALICLALRNQTPREGRPLRLRCPPRPPCSRPRPEPKWVADLERSAEGVAARGGGTTGGRRRHTGRAVTPKPHRNPRARVGVVA